MIQGTTHHAMPTYELNEHIVNGTICRKCFERHLRHYDYFSWQYESLKRRWLAVQRCRDAVI